MKLATWNINSIRAREERLLTWLGQAKPDVLCLQETKVEDAGFPLAPLQKAGYAVVTFGQRSYNGVAIASTVGGREFSGADGTGASAWQRGGARPFYRHAAGSAGERRQRAGDGDD